MVLYNFIIPKLIYLPFKAFSSILLKTKNTNKTILIIKLIIYL